MSASRTKSQIAKELLRWEVQSQKMKLTGSICYGKIRAHLSVWETLATKDEVNKIQSMIGNKC